MKIITGITDLQQHLKEIRGDQKKIGLVPTMGALHTGHISLIKASKSNNLYTIATVFVNRIQFNNPLDYDKYPRDDNGDVEKLELAGCDMVFIPSEHEMYLEFERKVYNLDNLDKWMEGQFRPGHFQGVAFIVHRFFNLISPDFAFFGEKDFQQLAIIKHVVKTENIPVKIIGCPTIREYDGLAMSSRNLLLTAEQRQIAPLIYSILCKARTLIQKCSVLQIKDYVAAELSNNPMFKLEYFELSDIETLAPVSDWTEPNNGVVGCIAVFMGNVRLIDNIKFL